MTSKEQFEKELEVLQTMLLTKEQGNIPQKQWGGFVHIAVSCMREAFECGESGSGTPDLIAKMESLNNPLAEGIASAMRWSYTEGMKARI